MDALLDVTVDVHTARMTDNLYWPSGYVAELFEYLKSGPTEAALSERTTRLVEKAAAGVVAYQLENPTRLVARELAANAAFEARLAGRWGPALDLFDLFVLRSRELGGELNQEHRPEAAKSQNLKFEMLIRLHGRAVQIGQEISVLMRAGFATAALARWRAMFEVWIVFSLLAEGDEELARRYAAHDAVEVMKGQKDHERNWEALGFDPPETDEAQRERLCEQLKAQFDAAFLKPYGWAAPLFDGTAPKLSDLRDRADLGIWSGHYRMASHGTHANPRGIFWSVQDGGWADVIPVGASNAGLLEPAQCALISLGNVSIRLLQYALDELLNSEDSWLQQTQALVFQRATLDFMDVAIDRFAEIAAVQDAEEADLSALIDAALSRLDECSLLTCEEVAESLGVARDDVDEALNAAVARGRISAETRYCLSAGSGGESS